MKALKNFSNITLKIKLYIIFMYCDYDGDRKIRMVFLFLRLTREPKHRVNFFNQNKFLSTRNMFFFNFGVLDSMISWNMFYVEFW